MSIWSSTTLPGMNAHEVGYNDPDGPPTCDWDVAIATSWNSCIRLAVYETEANTDAGVMLTVAQAEELIKTLQSAIKTIQYVREHR